MQTELLNRKRWNTRVELASVIFEYIAVSALPAAGVPQAVGGRWLRHAGSMPPLDLAAPSDRYLSFVELVAISHHRGDHTCGSPRPVAGSQSGC